MKVTAVEAVTGIEVVIAGPVRTAQTELERIALNKLRYVMRQRGVGPLSDDRAHKRNTTAEAERAPGSTNEGSSSSGGKGWIA